VFELDGELGQMDFVEERLELPTKHRQSRKRFWD
jgi:hypothetical protein